MPAKVGSGGAGLPWKVTTVAAAGGCFASVSVTRCKLQIIHVSERVHFFQKLSIKSMKDGVGEYM